MPNKSHFNSAHRAMNRLHKEGLHHSSFIDDIHIGKSFHAIFIEDAIEVLKRIPSNSVQLVLVDPPYNLSLEKWDEYDNFLDWAKKWLDEIYRILSDSGNCIIFGGFQFQDLKHGDLLEIMHYTRHNTNLRLINLIIWYYKNGMSAHRYFANRHEEAIWLSKTKKYYFDLDSVRVPYDEESKKQALKDKRLIPENIEKGKNPTNVWEIGRLNGNSVERVGHPTQKPLEIIRRFVKSMSYEGSVVMDFFAGSGTTGRVCIEENRHSILVDIDPTLKTYLGKHLDKMKDNLKAKLNNPSLFESNIEIPQYELLDSPNINDYFSLVTPKEKESEE